MNAKSNSSLDGTRALVRAGEEALAELEQQFPGGFGPLERALAARVSEAIGRLRECAAQLEVDPLMVRGSTGQQRSHPLLKLEQELRREVADGLQKLTFRVEQRAHFERLRAVHRARRRVGEDGSV
jgi:hypothetical protein